MKVLVSVTAVVIAISAAVWLRVLETQNAAHSDDGLAQPAERFLATLNNENLPQAERIDAAKELAAMRYEPAIPAMIKNITMTDCRLADVPEHCLFIDNEGQWFRGMVFIDFLAQYGTTAIEPTVAACFAIEDDNSWELMALCAALNSPRTKEHIKQTRDAIVERARQNGDAFSRKRATLMLRRYLVVDPALVPDELRNMD